MALATISLLVGCTKDLVTFDPGPSSSYSAVQTQGGLGVAVEPFTNGSEQTRYFGSNLFASNVLPLLILIENRSSSTSYIVDREKIRVTAPESSAEGVVHQRGSSDRTGDAWMLVNVYAAAKVGSDASVTNQSLAANEFRTATIEPGESVHGFFYVTVPEKARADRSWLIHIEAVDPLGRSTRVFDIPFELRLD